MKIGGNLTGFNISAEGLSVQRKKMNLIAENIANVDSVRDENGRPYQRKFLKVVQNEKAFFNNSNENGIRIKLAATKGDHFVTSSEPVKIQNPSTGIAADELIDGRRGEMVYMPENPDADPEGYVQMPNVNIITEMTDMIAATRSYEANLTALNAAKQIAKDSLEI
ncbi:MAG: flagellar basal body rod protein FlgC [Ignavibacteriaceae bacterium]